MAQDANQELITAIKKAALRGADLSRHLLAYSRRQTLRPRPVDLYQLVTGMNKTLLQNLGDGIWVEIKIGGRLWSIHADVTQVESAILHLACNARDAMQVISQGPLPELILADVVLLGGESGVEFVERLVRRFPQIKAVLMSGYTQDEATLETLSGHGHFFLQKPMNKARLSQMLHVALHGKA